MPELPEAESVRLGLDGLMTGRQIASVQVSGPRVARLQPGGGPELAGRLSGVRVREVARRGKFLWFTLDDGHALLAHLGMSGQFRYFGPQPGQPVPPLAHERARFTLADGGELVFADQRTFGYLLATDLIPVPDGLPGGQGTSLPAVPLPVAHIARDLLDPHLDFPGLVAAIGRRDRPVKAALLDQSLVSGIGNIYADEALWRARIHGERRASRLPAAQLKALLRAALDVMREALAAGGTSFDRLYVNVNGSSGYFARELHAYGREGEPCDRCGTPIVRAKFANRSSHYCPACQPRPRPRPGRKA